MSVNVKSVDDSNVSQQNVILLPRYWQNINVKPINAMSVNERSVDETLFYVVTWCYLNQQDGKWCNGNVT